MGNPVGVSLSAAEFIKKYGSCNLDQDLLTTGFQNDTITVEQFKADFNTLNTSDKYVVFTTYQNFGNRELLAEMLGLDKNNFPKVDAALFKNVEDFCDKIHKAAANNNANDGVWETRLMLALGLFTIDEMVRQLQPNIKDPKEVQKLRDSVFAQLKQLYILTSGSDGKNIFFNTDNDVLLENSLREFMFDHLDCDQYDPMATVDKDNDGIDDGIDSKAFDPTEWSGMAVGETRHTKTCDVERTKDGYNIIVKIRLIAGENLEDEQAVNKMLSDPKFREKIAGDINKFYTENRGAELAGISFTVELVGEDEDCHQEIEFEDGTERSNGQIWRLDVISSPQAMLHELFHRIGQDDYYHEALVENGIRDRMTSPGFEAIDPDNIMNDGSHITVGQMRKIILYALKTEAIQFDEAFLQSDESAQVDILWFMFASNSPLDKQQLSAIDINEVFAEIKAKLAKQPESTELLLCATRLALMLGKENEAKAFISALEKSRFGEKILFQLYDVPGAAAANLRPEFNEQFIKLNKNRALANEGTATAYGLKLISMKKFAELENFVKTAAKKFAKPDELAILKAVIAAEKTSPKAAMPQLRQAVKSSSFYETLAVFEYLLDKGAVKEAINTGLTKLPELDIANILIGRELYDEAIGICLEAINTNPLNTDMITALIKCLRNKGDIIQFAGAVEKLFTAFYIMTHHLELDKTEERTRALDELSLTPEECDQLREIFSSQLKTAETDSESYLVRMELMRYLTAHGTDQKENEYREETVQAGNTSKSE